MKNILFLCHRIPYPPNKGDKIRSYNILKHLTKTKNVSLGFLIDDPKDHKYVSTLKEQCEHIFYDQIQSFRKKIYSLGSALLNNTPITIPFFYSTKLQNQLDDFLDKESIDTIVCSSSPTAEYIFRSRHYQHLVNNVHLVMDFIDMDSQKWSQYASREGFPLSIIYSREASKLFKYEQKIECVFKQLFIVSEAEKKLFQELIPTEKITAISNGVDLDFFNPEFHSDKHLPSPSLVFTGAMDYWPNIDGAIWFVENVLPLIKLSFPDVIFYLVGSNPSSELNKLEANEGVVITGFVDDIRDYIQQADVCVIPLRIARGIQNKVLEAMAMGKAIVSTPEAAEGLNIDLEKDISIKNEADSFADEVISLLSNRDKTVKLGINARKVVEKNYSWELNLSTLDSVINPDIT